MTIRLSNESASELTARWHDQTLDLQSLAFDEAKRQCVFTVTEPKESTAHGAKFGLQKMLLRNCRVTIKNVSHVEVRDADGEVELYINEVEASPTGLCFKCVNGALEILGHALETSLDVELLDSAGETQTEVRLTTPLGDASWRRRHTKPPS